MKNFSTWMIVMFMAMFWVFRVLVAVSSEFGSGFAGFEPLNLQMEIILLFVVLVCMILVIKRKLVGGLIYLLGYGMYFGVDLFNNVSKMLEAGEEVSMLSIYANSFASLLGMILAIAVLLDLLADKGRKANPKDKKTDWFYTNEQYDRQMDDRADKNNYRTL